MKNFEIARLFNLMADVLELKEENVFRIRVADVEALEGFGRKSATNLMEAVAASRGRGLARLFNALGIRLVGEHVARELAARSAPRTG